MHSAESSGAYVPAKHTVQFVTSTVAKRAVLYVPVGQILQFGAIALLCLPAGQMRHSVAAIPEYVPPEQPVHFVTFNSAARAPLKVPLGHVLQFPLTLGLYFPASHAMHSPASLLLYVPAGQLEQTGARSALNLPPGQM